MNKTYRGVSLGVGHEMEEEEDVERAVDCNGSRELG